MVNFTSLLTKSSSNNNNNNTTNSSAFNLNRKRKKKEITFKDIQECFDLPIKEAADNLGISLTQLKRICREQNIPRWPFRKLQALKNKAQELLEVCEKSDELTRQRLKSKIDAIYDEINFIKEHPKTIVASSGSKRNSISKNKRWSLPNSSNNNDLASSGSVSSTSGGILEQTFKNDNRKSLNMNEEEFYQQFSQLLSKQYPENNVQTMMNQLMSSNDTRNSVSSSQRNTFGSTMSEEVDDTDDIYFDNTDDSAQSSSLQQQHSYLLNNNNNSNIINKRRDRLSLPQLAMTNSNRYMNETHQQQIQQSHNLYNNNFNSNNYNNREEYSQVNNGVVHSNNQSPQILSVLQQQQQQRINDYSRLPPTTASSPKSSPVTQPNTSNFFNSSDVNLFGQQHNIMYNTNANNIGNNNNNIPVEGLYNSNYYPHNNGNVMNNNNTTNVKYNQRHSLNPSLLEGQRNDFGFGRYVQQQQNFVLPPISALGNSDSINSFYNNNNHISPPPNNMDSSYLMNSQMYNKHQQQSPPVHYPNNNNGYNINNNVGYIESNPNYNYVNGQVPPPSTSTTRNNLPSNQNTGFYGNNQQEIIQNDTRYNNENNISYDDRRKSDSKISVAMNILRNRKKNTSNENLSLNYDNYNYDTYNSGYVVNTNHLNLPSLKEAPFYEDVQDFRNMPTTNVTETYFNNQNDPLPPQMVTVPLTRSQSLPSTSMSGVSKGLLNPNMTTQNGNAIGGSNNQQQTDEPKKMSFLESLFRKKIPFFKKRNK
ncbi:hypothetical protein ABK040_006597 [Willaertia magna]